jgi:hypothetical protein
VLAHHVVRSMRVEECHDLRVRASEGVVVDHNPNAGIVVEVDDIVLWLETVEIA